MWLRNAWRSVRHSSLVKTTAGAVRGIYPLRVAARTVRSGIRQAISWALKLRLFQELQGYFERKRLFAEAVTRTFGEVVPRGGVALPGQSAPLVSILIPVHNQWRHTLWCLRSIIANSGDVPYEVIIADDASTDATRRVGRRVPNVRVMRNDPASGGPLGFLKNCNAAAALARGKYLLFLNNDTLVQKDWLRALVQVAEQDASVGLVGCKLIFPDGQLQEAGGIIWRDGTGSNHGRGQSPDAAEFNHIRDVDYISGAAILVRHSVWDAIGGFDERFAPAYYEDTDLAFAIRARGNRVVYQPLAEVIHFEGVSHGTDIQSGVKRHQAVNQTRFVEKWKSVLDGSHFAPNTDLFLARNRTRARKHVLVVDKELPVPDHFSGSQRMVSLLKILSSQDCCVTFYPIADKPFQPFLQDCLPYLRACQQLGVYAVCGENRPSLEAFLREYGRYFDLAIVSFVDVGAMCMDLLRQDCPKALIAFDTVDLHFLRERRCAQLANDVDAEKAAEGTKQRELQLMRQADLTLVVSRFEADLLRQEAPGVDVRVLSNIHAVHDRGRPFHARKDLLFIGNFFHVPNEDGVRWFAESTLPEIRRRLGDVRLQVIGDLTDAMRSFSAEGVQVLGHVKDIEPYLQSCRLSVAPLRYGAGVKGKINTAMSYGLPVVSTTIGCEGMHLQNEVDVLVADDASTMADAVCRLYEDEHLWEQLSQAGRANIQRHFSFETAETVVREILEISPKLSAQFHFAKCSEADAHRNDGRDSTEDEAANGAGAPPQA